MSFNLFFLLILTSQISAAEDENKNSTIVSSELIAKISEDLRFYSHNQNDRCLSILIIRATESFSKMCIMIPESEENERLIKNLQKKFLNSLFTDPDKFINIKKSFDFQLFLFYHNFTIRDVIKSRNLSLRAKFLVLVKNYEDVVKNLQEFWKYRHVDVVAAYVKNSTAYYYTYYPYSKDHCWKIGQPVLFAECDLKKGKFTEKAEGFLPKANNLHGCVINITLSAISPAVHFSGNKLTGMEVEFMDELMNEMSAVPNYILHEPEEVRYGLNGYKHLLEKSDIAGGVAMSLKNVAETDFFTYGQSVCVTWAVPVQPRRKGVMRTMYHVSVLFPFSLGRLSFGYVCFRFFRLQFGS